MKKYKMRVCGYKNWKMVPLGACATIEGEEVSVEYEIEANDYREAEREAINDFRKRGYYFDEIDITSINYMDELMNDDEDW
jgi:hypothetical protein